MAVVREARTAAPTADPQPQREFEFSAADFRALAKIAYQHAGITLPEAKQNLVYGRLSRRLRTLGMSSFEEYRKYLNEHADQELEPFINSLSTNHTKFFREPHHFEHFVSNVVAPFAAAHPSGGRMRIWSAGCSTGEEPHTIALILATELKNIASRDIRILATDIDTEVLRRASQGVFSAESVSAVPAKYRGALSKSGDGDSVAIDRNVCSLITFGRLNFMEEWPVRGPFDVIFCRNVMIYFDGPTKLRLRRAFYRSAQGRRVALYRPFGVSARLAPTAETCRSHDLPENAVKSAAAKVASAPSPAAIQAGRTARRFYDSAQAAWVVKILPGEFYVTADPEEVLVTVLGSCVSACIRDPAMQIGGMNHFMLVQNKSGTSGAWGNELESARFGNFAMEKLINGMLKLGCHRDRLEIKVFGGANVTTARNEIGTDNGKFVLRYLQDEGLACAAQDLGGVHPRRIIYFPMTGKVVRRLLTGSDQDSALREETDYATKLVARKPATDIQLFK